MQEEDLRCHDVSILKLDRHARLCFANALDISRNTARVSRDGNSSKAA